MKGSRRPFSALDHRPFRLFLAGQIVSLLGWWLQVTAQSWLVYRLTHSPAMLGLVGFASNVPTLVFGLAAGSVVDRCDRRRLVLWCQVAAMIEAFVAAALTASGLIQVWHIVLLALGLGVVGALEIPARQTLYMDIVGRDDLVSAIAMNSTAFNVARVLGPSLAGLALAHVSESVCFLINGFSFLGVIAALASIRLTPKAPAPVPEGNDDRWAGLRHLAAHADMRDLLAQVALVNLCALPALQLLPVIAVKVLEGGPRTLGLLNACAGVGALVSGLMVASLPPARLTPALAGGGMAVVIVSLGILASTNSPWIAGAALVALGFGKIVQLATTNNYLQLRAPDHLRGRVISTYTTTLVGMFPVGSLMLGRLAEWVGVQEALFIGAAICLVGSVTLRVSRRLRM